MKQSHPMTEQQRKLELIKPFDPFVVETPDGDFMCHWDKRALDLWVDGSVLAEELSGGVHSYCDDPGIDDTFLIAFARGGFDEVRRVSQSQDIIGATDVENPTATNSI